MARFSRPRGTLAKSAVTPVWKPPKAQPDTWHHHGCVDCGGHYTDTGGCHTGGEDGLCSECRDGRERPLWDRHGDPQACCLKNSVPVISRETRTIYRLGGTGVWWQCRTCKRAQVYRPITIRPAFVPRSRRGNDSTAAEPGQ